MTDKMNPVVKELWVKGLRSGEYEQGKNQLRDSNGKFCCLGVLCDLYTKETGRGNWDKDGCYLAPDSDYKLLALLPKEIITWAGLSNDNPKAGNHILTHMNDTLSSSFEEIATQIENNL